MTEKFSIDELQHMMTMMNCGGYGVGYCMMCAGIRVKLEALIKKEQEKPVREITEIAGHTVTVERARG